MVMDFIVDMKLDEPWPKDDVQHMKKRRGQTEFESLNFKDQQMNSNIKKALEDFAEMSKSFQENLN